MQLTHGIYQTRNARIAVMYEPFSRDKLNGNGETVRVTGFRGHLMKADGKTPDSDHEWEDTLQPNTLGVLVRAGATEGVANEFDLVRRIE